MEETYERWKKDPTPERMGELLTAANPVLSSAVQSYAGGNQALMSQARKLAAGAFQTYDPKKGTKLRTHLMTQLQPLTRASKAYGAVAHVPERISMDFFRLRQEQQKLFDRMGREASDTELADSAGLSMRRIARVRAFGKGETSESALKDDEGSIMYPGTSQADPERIMIEYVHHDLSPVDQKILEWRTGLYGKEQISNNDIAKRLGLTPGAISQRASNIARRVSELKGTL